MNDESKDTNKPSNESKTEYVVTSSGILGFIERHYKWFVYPAIALAFVLGGMYLEHNYFNKGINAADYTHDGTTDKKNAVNVKGDAETKTNTVISYLPKQEITHRVIQSDGSYKTVTELEKTDMDANIGKPTFNVKVNGKEATFTKAENEKYMFDKNKLSLQQDSKVDFNVHVDPVIVDNTKYWGIGVGVTTDRQMVYKISFPVNKKAHIEGWVLHSDKVGAGGVEVKF